MNIPYTIKMEFYDKWELTPAQKILPGMGKPR